MDGHVVHPNGYAVYVPTLFKDLLNSLLLLGLDGHEFLLCCLIFSTMGRVLWIRSLCSKTPDSSTIDSFAS